MSLRVSQRRKRYVANACQECRKRKIKCSGDEPCHSCRVNCLRICRYDRIAKRLNQNRNFLHTKSMNDLSQYEDFPLLTGQLIRHKNLDNTEFSLESIRQHDGNGLGYAPLGLALPPSMEFFETCLYPSEELEKLLECFFNEIETFYPCFDREDYYCRLSQLFAECTPRSNDSSSILATHKWLSLSALTCQMACIGAYLGGAASSRMPDEHFGNEAWKWHSESRRILGRMPFWRESPNMDLLRLHIIEVVYMIILQRPGGVSRAVATTVDLAFALKLHKEETWSDLCPRERAHNRLMWWTVCFIERRIALNTDRPLLFRTSDFAVGMHNAESKMELLSTPVRGASVATCKVQRPSSLPRTRAWFEYIVFAAEWSNLTAELWDRFFSPQSVVDDETAMKNIVLADIQLLQLRNKLPTNLLWDAALLPANMQLGDLDRNLRMQLIILEAIDILRICIRKGKQQHVDARMAMMSHADQQPIRNVDTIAADLLNAITGYLGVRKHIRPWSTYGSILLVQVASHIAPPSEIPHEMPFHVAQCRTKAINSIIAAQECLKSVEIEHAVQGSKLLNERIRYFESVRSFDKNHLLPWAFREKEATIEL